MGKVQGAVVPYGTRLSQNAQRLLFALIGAADGEGAVRMPLRAIASRSGLSLQSVRTALGELSSTQLVTQEVTQRVTQITFCHSSTCTTKATQQSTQRVTQTSTRKTKPKEKVDEELEKRAHAFGQTLIPYVELYGKDMIRAFYDYWTEPNPSHSRMRWEMQRTWDVGRRLERWSRNNEGKTQGGYRRPKAEAYEAANSEWED